MRRSERTVIFIQRKKRCERGMKPRCVKEKGCHGYHTSKYYPLARKIAELGRKHHEHKKQPTTPQEHAAEYKAAVDAMVARGDFKDFQARMNSCKTDEERSALSQEFSMALEKEVNIRRDPELVPLMYQLIEQLEQDGKLEEFMLEKGPEEVREAWRKKKTAKGAYDDRHREY